MLFSYFERIGQLRFNHCMRLRSEPIIEASVIADVIRLRPLEAQHATATYCAIIAEACGNVGWRVTNSYLVTFFGWRTSNPYGLLGRFDKYPSPIEIGRNGQRFVSGWDSLAGTLGQQPIPLSLDNFLRRSQTAILSTMGRGEWHDYYLSYMR